MPNEDVASTERIIAVSSWHSDTIHAAWVGKTFCGHKCDGWLTVERTWSA